MSETSSTYWEIELLGGISVRHGQHLTRLKTSKTSELLAYLALHSGCHSREYLAELLWPEANDSTTGRTSLRTALSSLSKQLEPRDSRGRLLAVDNTSIGLDMTACRVDTEQFNATLIKGRHAVTPVYQLEAYEAAIAVYKGPLLPGFYSEWIIEARRHLEEEFQFALLKLTNLLTETEQAERAIETAKRLIRLDPGDEEATRLLMLLFANSGQKQKALKAFSNLKRALHAQYKSDPSHAILQLAEQIRCSPGSLPKPQLQTQAIASPSGVEALRAPVKTPPSDHSRTIPPRATAFFGRDDEVWQVVTLLTPKEPYDVSQIRLVTLTGMGGIGKTRLAIEATQSLQAKFARFAYIPLATITDARLIADAILQALSVSRETEIDAIEQLVENLRGHATLLVLDNFEQLLDCSSPEADGTAILQHLMKRLPHLRCLVTSRQTLGLAGEYELVVRPLPVPPEGAVKPSEIDGYPAVQLYLRRAQEKKPDFVATERTAPAIAELCCRLDGIPLALELAAACINDYPPSRILADFENRFFYLKSRFRDLSERHQTLYMAIDWSYRTLSPDIQHFFATLGIFRGGFTRDAAIGISGYAEAPQFLEQLKSRSLLIEEGSHPATQFILLDTLRDFALRNLAEEQKQRLLRRHAAYYFRLARRTAFQITGPDQEHLLEMLERENDNLRACLNFLMGRKVGLRMTGALHQFWYVRGHTEEGLRYMERMLLQSKDTPVKLRSSILNGMGVFAWQMGDLGKAENLLQQALKDRIVLDDSFGIAGLNNNLGLLAKLQGNLEKASEKMKLSIVIYRQLRQDRLLAGSLDNLAEVCIEQEGFSEAKCLLDECEQLLHKSADNSIFASMLTHRGMLAHRQDDKRQAYQYFQQALRMRESLKANHEIASVLLQLAVLAREQGMMPRAVMLCAAATRLSEVFHFRLSFKNKGILDHCLEQARQSLSPNRYASSWSQGYVLSPGESVTFACDLTSF